MSPEIGHQIPEIRESRFTARTPEQIAELENVTKLINFRCYLHLR